MSVQQRRQRPVLVDHVLGTAQLGPTGAVHGRVQRELAAVHDGPDGAAAADFRSCAKHSRQTRYDGRFVTPAQHETIRRRNIFLHFTSKRLRRVCTSFVALNKFCCTFSERKIRFKNINFSHPIAHPLQQRPTMGIVRRKCNQHATFTAIQKFMRSLFLNTCCHTLYRNTSPMYIFSVKPSRKCFSLAATYAVRPSPPASAPPATQNDAASK